ncbi:MAG: type IV pilin N-terminal domain-containing protein [Candidatus Methanoculleus thermohydrogenotrophicum]|jgi:FlaG/FlaF family flagellin (archaellin)
MNDRNQHDDAVSSVVGEMIMIVLVIILVALFATSAFSLVPGGREASVDVVMKNESEDTMVVFWHKGGDWVEKKDLTVLVINKSGNRKEYRPEGVFDHQDNSVEAFDLGGYLNVTIDPSLGEGDIVRLVTPKNVIYSGVVPEAK